MSASRFTAQDAGLFLVLMIVVDGVVLPGLLAPRLISAPLLMAMFHMALFPHVGATLYLGTFGTLRTVTWLLLIAVSAASEIAIFLSYILPWQGAALRVVNPAVWPTLVLPVLGLDVIVMHYEEWRTRSVWQIAVFLAAVIAATVALNLALSSIFALPPPSAFEDGIANDAFAIVPPWHVLPLYAILRAIPDKALGTVVTCAALFVPMIWPWARTDLLRIGRTRWVWRLLCAIFCSTWIGLGWLGAQPPEGLALRAAQVLATFYFAYFLLSPVAARLLGRAADRVSKNETVAALFE